MSFLSWPFGNMMQRLIHDPKKKQAIIYRAFITQNYCKLVTSSAMTKLLQKLPRSEKNFNHISNIIFFVFKETKTVSWFTHHIYFIWNEQNEKIKNSQKRLWDYKINRFFSENVNKIIWNGISEKAFVISW